MSVYYGYDDFCKGSPNVIFISSRTLYGCIRRCSLIWRKCSWDKEIHSNSFLYFSLVCKIVPNQNISWLKMKKQSKKNPLFSWFLYVIHSIDFLNGWHHDNIALTCLQTVININFLLFSYFFGNVHYVVYCSTWRCEWSW